MVETEGKETVSKGVMSRQWFRGAQKKEKNTQNISRFPCLTSRPSLPARPSTPLTVGILRWLCDGVFLSEECFVRSQGAPHIRRIRLAPVRWTHSAESADIGRAGEHWLTACSQTARAQEQTANCNLVACCFFFLSIRKGKSNPV